MIHTEFKISIVRSLFNPDVTGKLLEGAYERLIEKNICKNNIDIVEVPGAVEIPLIAKFLAISKKYDAIICLGSVIRGETDHYNYVCQQVSQGCQHVMLEFNIPIIFGILTTENIKQANDRIDKFKKHKGIESADSAIKMIDLIKKINSN